MSNRHNDKLGTANVSVLNLLILKLVTGTKYTRKPIPKHLPCGCATILEGHDWKKWFNDTTCSPKLCKDCYPLLFIIWQQRWCEFIKSTCFHCCTILLYFTFPGIPPSMKFESCRAQRHIVYLDGTSLRFLLFMTQNECIMLSSKAARFVVHYTIWQLGHFRFQYWDKVFLVC